MRQPIRTSIIHRAPPRQQRGIVMVLAAIAMLVLLAMAGLALDGGHLLLSKTRLQNALDAAALSAAKTLNDTNDQGAASTAATATFVQNAQTPGNEELLEAYQAGEIAIAPQYSATLVPFVPGSAPPLFVRITVPSFTLDTWLVQVVGVMEAQISGSAVAGPSPPLTNNVCHIAPLLLCGQPDANVNDGTVYGFATEGVSVLKIGSNQSSPIGPGNFQLLDLPNGSGAASVRNALAGDYDPNSCATAGESVDTEPGNAVGPVVQGMNTRFGEYAGPMNGTQSQFPPDWSTGAPNPRLTLNGSGQTVFTNGTTYSSPGQLTFNHGNYSAAYTANAGAGWCSQSDTSGRCHRRILTVPVGNCTGKTNGANSVPVLGFACVYVVQTVEQKGNEAHVFAQMVGSCDSSGQPTINPVAGPLPTRIVLYKDPASEDS